MPKTLPSKPWTLPALPAKNPRRTYKKASGALADRAIRRRLGLDKRLYQCIQQNRAREWGEIVRAFESNPDFYNAYWWLQHHPMFHRFRTWGDRSTSPLPVRHERHLIAERGIDMVDMDVVRVNPKTKRIDRDPALNTATHVWLETGPVLWGTDRGTPTHDIRLDCGAKTYERAVIKLAKRVHRLYGNDRQIADAEQAADVARHEKAKKPMMSVPKAVR